jgi:hypothetical protein
MRALPARIFMSRLAYYPTVHSTLLVIAHSIFYRYCGKSDRRIGAAGKRVGYAGRGAQIIQLWALLLAAGSRLDGMPAVIGCPAAQWVNG